jgi:hypothetical protein
VAGSGEWDGSVEQAEVSKAKPGVEAWWREPAELE